MFKIMARHVVFFFVILSSLLFSLSIDAKSMNALAQFNLTISSGAHGTVTPSVPIIVNSGADATYMATPNAHYMVDQWKVDGQNVQTGGVSFTLKNITSNHAITVSFIPKSVLYAAGANSYLYYSRDQGLTWKVTPQRPNSNNAIGSVFSTDTTLYVATTSKFLFSSMNHGVSWRSSSPTPDNSRIECVFVTPANTIYIGTKSGHVYYSTNGGLQWTATSNRPSAGFGVKSIHIAGAAIYAGSTDGNVYYSPDGVVWSAINGMLDGSPIQDIHIANNTLYVNTQNQYVYTSSELTGGGTWDLFAQTVFSSFVSSDATIHFAATQNGYLFSLVSGDSLGFVSYTPINSIYYLA